MNTAPHTPPVDAQEDPEGPIDDITLGWQIDYFVDFLAPVSPRVARFIAGSFPLGGTDDMALFSTTGLITPGLLEQVEAFTVGQRGWAKTRLHALTAYLETAS